jgi:transcriptional regulator with XRE-family HTH domain
MNAKERLQKFVEYKGLGRNRFEELVGISSGYLSAKSPSVGSEIIEKIARIYHDLNIEWLVTGNGKMIKALYWNEIETAGKSMYRKLIYAPLVSRYAQAEYLNRLNEKPYIDTLPTLPVTADHDNKGGYICFEMWDESMNDGSDNSYNIGDILICRETDCAVRQRRLYFNKPKPYVVVHAHNGIMARLITAHDLDKELVTLHSPNPMYDDNRVQLQEIRKLFAVLQLQRNTV